MNDNQGREGMQSVNASRAVFGMPPLSGDEPDLDLPGWVKFMCVVAACVCMAIACGACDPLFPQIR